MCSINSIHSLYFVRTTRRRVYNNKKIICSHLSLFSSINIYIITISKAIVIFFFFAIWFLLIGQSLKGQSPNKSTIKHKKAHTKAQTTKHQTQKKTQEPKKEWKKIKKKIEKVWPIKSRHVAANAQVLIQVVSQICKNCYYFKRLEQFVLYVTHRWEKNISITLPFLIMLISPLCAEFYYQVSVYACIQILKQFTAKK